MKRTREIERERERGRGRDKTKRGSKKDERKRAIERICEKIGRSRKINNMRLIRRGKREREREREREEEERESQS